MLVGRTTTVGSFAKDKAPTDTWRASRSLGEWWTRQERIRTMCEVPFQVPLLIVEEPPLHQTIAEKAKHLQQLGMNNNRIAKALGVDFHTVKKALSGGKR